MLFSADDQRAKNQGDVRRITSALAPIVGPNIDITGDNDASHRQQAEPTIAIDPRDPRIIVAGAQDYRLIPKGGHRWHGYYRSTDAGHAWAVSLLPGFPGDNSTNGLSSPLRGFSATSDPVLAFDRQGNVYYTGIAFNITIGSLSLGSSTAFVAKYVENGRDYAWTSLIQNITYADKPWIAIDTTGGPTDGNVYVAVDGTSAATSTSFLTRSIDGGKTFSAPTAVPFSPGIFPSMAIDPDGNVYVSTLGYNIANDRPVDLIQVSRLTNGGTVLEGTTIAAHRIVFPPSPLAGNRFRIFTLPQIAADERGVYVAWNDYRTGNLDVLLVRSLDGGRTWSSPIRVNDVATNQQFFPSIAASGGILSAIWYDSRLNNGDMIQNLDVFYSQSLDYGATFSPSFRVTTASFNPNIVKRTDAPDNGSPFIGDYIQVAATPTSIRAVWTDNRNADRNVDPIAGPLNQDIFTATIVPVPRHDVAVVGLVPSTNYSYSEVNSQPISLELTVANLGSELETVNVNLAANSTAIASQTLAVDPGGTGRTILEWNTTSLLRGEYVLSATASPVPGEVSLSDNKLTSLFVVRKAGDVNMDGRVDIVDMILVWEHQSSRRDPSAYDLNNDGVVDKEDLVLVWLGEFS